MGPMRMNRMVATEKGDFKSIKKLIVYCKRYLPAIIVATILAVGGAVATIIGPQFIKELTDKITEGLKLATGIDLDAVFTICITLVAIT